MAKPKDREYHADGTMTAAEFKRRFMNKKARLRSVEAVAVRSNIGVMKNVTKEKQRLRNFTTRTEPNPGTFYNAGNAKATQAGVHPKAWQSRRATAHLVSSF